MPAAIEHILPEGRIRLSRFSQMRDPRESKWAFSATLMGELQDSDRLYWEMFKRVDEIKAEVRILSLTADLLPHEPTGDVFSRGYSHPRLWEQYAGNHRGICLCLKADSLIEAATAQVGDGLRHGFVSYRNGRIAYDASTVDLNAVSNLGVDLALEEHLERNFDELFFTKLQDWATEVEYRFIVRSSEPAELHVDIESSLDEVIAGENLAREYGPSLRALCDGEIALTTVWWENGHPHLIQWPEGRTS